MTESTVSTLVRQDSAWSIVLGVLLVIFGALAVGSPFLAATAVNAIIAWLIVLAGVVHLIIAFSAPKVGNLIWKVLVGIAYLCFGAYLIMHPVLGVASLTLLLATLFLIEGIFAIGMYFGMSSVGRSNWVLLDGIITLVLGLMIYMQWPSSSAWVIGTLVGVSMISSGVTRVMLSMALRKSAAAIA